MATKDSWAEEVAATVAGLIAKHVKPGGVVSEGDITKHFPTCWYRYHGVYKNNGMDKMQASRSRTAGRCALSRGKKAARVTPCCGRAARPGVRIPLRRRPTFLNYGPHAGTPGNGKARRRNAADKDSDGTPAGGGGGAPARRADGTPACGGGGGRARARRAGGTPANGTPRRALEERFGTTGGGGSLGDNELGGGGDKYKSAPAFGDSGHASYLVTSWGAHLDAAAADLNAAKRVLSDAQRNTTAAKSALEEISRSARGRIAVAKVAVESTESKEAEARGNAAAAARATKRFTVLLVSADSFGGAELVGAGTVAADAMSTVGPAGDC